MQQKACYAVCVGCSLLLDSGPSGYPVGLACVLLHTAAPAKPEALTREGSARPARSESACRGVRACREGATYGLHMPEHTGDASGGGRVRTGLTYGATKEQAASVTGKFNVVELVVLHGYGPVP